MKKDTGIRVKYGVPYFIVRVMAIGMLFLYDYPYIVR